jgi:hypothetical protein
MSLNCQTNLESSLVASINNHHLHHLKASKPWKIYSPIHFSDRRHYCLALGTTIHVFLRLGCQAYITYHDNGTANVQFTFLHPPRPFSTFSWSTCIEGHQTQVQRPAKIPWPWPSVLGFTCATGTVHTVLHCRLPMEYTLGLFKFAPCQLPEQALLSRCHFPDTWAADPRAARTSCYRTLRQGQSDQVSDKTTTLGNIDGIK